MRRVLFFCKDAGSVVFLCVSPQAKMIMSKKDISNCSTEYAVKSSNFHGGISNVKGRLHSSNSQ